MLTGVHKALMAILIRDSVIKYSSNSHQVREFEKKDAVANPDTSSFFRIIDLIINQIKVTSGSVPIIH